MILDAEASSWRGCHGRCLRRGILWPSSSLSNGWMVGETMRRLAKDLGDQGCFGASMVRRNITIQKPGILGGDPISHQSYMFYYVVLFFENIYLKPKASKVLLFLADPHKGPLTEIGFQSRSRLNICFNSLCWQCKCCWQLKQNRTIDCNQGRLSGNFNWGGWIAHTFSSINVCHLGWVGDSKRKECRHAPKQTVNEDCMPNIQNPKSGLHILQFWPQVLYHLLEKQNKKNNAGQLRTYKSNLWAIAFLNETSHNNS